APCSPCPSSGSRSSSWSSLASASGPSGCAPPTSVSAPPSRSRRTTPMADAPERYDEIHGKIVHVYDGIEEADNQLPKWWVATSLFAVLFGVGYWFYFHTFAVGKLPMEAYAEQMAAAAAASGEVTPELLDAMSQSGPEV